jgi:oligogalacturonide lyase
MGRKWAGSQWESELKVSRDPLSGATVRQYTSYLGHSSHFYFTYPCWFDHNRKLLFSSDRENQTNFFSVDLASGEIMQMTDLDPAKGLPNVFQINKNPAREEAYFFQGSAILALDLRTLTLREVYQVPHGYIGEGCCAAADGKSLIIGLYQDLSDRFPVDMDNGYVGFREYWEARPHGQILQLDLDSGSLRTVYEEDYWLGHFNPSPVVPGVMTFCHEGPWELVDNRIWGLDLNSGKAWKIRPTAAGESVGHEYWMPDGRHIGYHGHIAGKPIYGSIAYDNTDMVEAPFAFNSWHNHSFHLDLVVGDGAADNPYLLLWRYRAGQFEGPKALAWHRGSFHTQRVHVHPCFSPDGRQIAYTADPQGYGQIFVVDVPEFETLPDHKPLKA